MLNELSRHEMNGDIAIRFRGVIQSIFDYSLKYRHCAGTVALYCLRRELFLIWPPPARGWLDSGTNRRRPAHHPPSTLPMARASSGLRSRTHCTKALARAAGTVCRMREQRALKRAM